MPDSDAWNEDQEHLSSATFRESSHLTKLKIKEKSGTNKIPKRIGLRPGIRWGSNYNKTYNQPRMKLWSVRNSRKLLSKTLEFSLDL